jgi:LysR family nitrogen assimilation transcriptional regulator
MVDIRQLRYFVAIADQQSMSLASQKLGVAQPSLSHHVMRVEEELGVRLLVRSTRGVTLTESGRRLYGHARDLLRAFEAALCDVREQASEELSGPVNFAFPSSVSNVLTVPLAETVRNEFPKLVLRAMDAMSGYVQTWLLEGTIDFGVLYDSNGARELTLRPLLVEPLYLVAARDCWRGDIGANGVACETVTLRECADLGLILPHRAHGLRETVERCAQSQSVSLDVVLEMDSLSRIKTMVSRGSGYSILAHAAVHEEIERGELILVPIREPAIRRTVYLATNPNRPLKRAAREVAALAEEIARELVRKGYWRGDLVAPAEAPPKGCEPRASFATKVRRAAE